MVNQSSWNNGAADLNHRRDDVSQRHRFLTDDLHTGAPCRSTRGLHPPEEAAVMNTCTSGWMNVT